ncbi:MAG: siphovirus Gp157 family protein [Candidatus Heimdallarchaeota archaeon]|nr:siphovirus Gp157 family protein [Candidatus Heimdallarchaeota archaeon]
MLNMYELNVEYSVLNKMIDKYAEENGGDITDFPLNDELERLEGERNEKLLNLAVWVKDLKGQAEAWNKEIKRLQAGQKALINKAEGIKEFIDYNLQKGEKLSDVRASLSYRKSTQVVLDVPVEDLPPEVVKISFTPDKTLIKKVIESSSDCDYAHLQENHSLQIK